MAKSMAKGAALGGVLGVMATIPIAQPEVGLLIGAPLGLLGGLAWSLRRFLGGGG